MITTILNLVCLLIAIAYYTLSERKIIAAIQRRQGPQVVGWHGLLQPLADGLKVLTKEVIIPRTASKWLFILSSAYMLVISLTVWCFIPINPNKLSVEENLSANFFNGYLFFNKLVNSPLNLLLLLAISSLGIYGIIFSGWASNSKYALIGSLRSAAQMISYEVSLSLLVIPVLFMASSGNILEIVEAQKNVWNVFFLWPVAFMFFVCSLAETNRTPFDLPEAEAELVAGYNIDYSSLPFALFFLGEYSNMLIMSSLNVLLFWGGWFFLPFVNKSLYLSDLLAALVFGLKLAIFAFIFVLVRAILPRYRYDQLMFLQWKIFLPYAILFILWLVGNKILAISFFSTTNPLALVWSLFIL